MTSTFSNHTYIRRKTKPALILMVILILLTYLISSKSAAADDDAKDLKAGRMVWPDGRKMMLGSRPPSCSGKCSKCRPCRASLVLPPTKAAAAGGDESYYLLSWKCRCGSKYYLP